MEGYVVAFIIGIVCVVLGVFNMRGHISSLHSYHRHRVSEKDRIPFGKKVGLGTIICGCAIMQFSILSTINLYIQNQILNIVGTVLLIAGLVAGIGLSLYAMIKYNKGIF